MKKSIMIVPLALNVVFVVGLIAGVACARRTMLDMESLCAEAESARLISYVSILESDREDKIKHVTFLMSNAIKDNEEGRPSVKAPGWCWRP
ncbi:MAG: hypothetical protein JW741_02085 [Sedimentisphaerales bacterium]|nr:hypothetical protein [Sedimentisphaerales bacterium]